MWDALLYSIKVNGTYGVAITNADKRKAVTLILKRPEWRNMSDVKIAKLSAFSPAFVGDVRREPIRRWIDRKS